MIQLPNEIWLRIISRFSAPEPIGHHQTVLDFPPPYEGSVYSDLARFCRVSRSWYTFARPKLYEKLDLRMLYGQQRLLLATIASKPQLAVLVKKLLMSSWEMQDEQETGENDEDNDQNDSNETDDEQTMTILAHQNRFPGPAELRAKLVRGVRRFQEDAEVALLVGLCVNLRFLAFEATHLMQDSLFLVVLQQNATSRGAMQLQELHVHHWDTEGFATTSNIASILWLPPLQRFTGYALNWDGGESLSKSSTLTSFRLYNCQVAAEAFPVFLRSCPNLEELIVVNDDRMDGGIFVLDYHAIGTALRNYAPHLRRFVYNDDDAECYDDNPRHAPLGDISTLTSLQELTVTGLMLFGEDDETLYDAQLNDAGSLHQQRVDVKPLTKSLPTSLVKLRVTGEYFNDFVDEEEWFRDLRNDPKFVNLVRIHEVVITNGFEKIVAKY